MPESTFQQSIFLQATLLQNKKRTVFNDKELKKQLLSEAKTAIANEPDLVNFVAHSISAENPPAFTGNTIYALHDILKEIEPLNISDLVHDFDLPDPPVPDDPVDTSSIPQVSLSSLPPDIRHLLTPSNTHQTSIYENELDDRTQYAFGRGKNTTKISTRDLLKQQKR
ncbi:Oidioi.mRNA.OKI2018_I69.chr2.g8344.t1.cds [Oikopleura dioica]|uniref:Oidioi.mRNA.OKI2018_I69.chr2.g8344.t1.cds n=1 Tax=Oikopleura dioica TaxID=34765 RepID=A0ABN7TDE6_OIKDI|nr:Oidioi.mRNA.OKI2018_I69.chr2.g8344.t1.cds [Oikopleura dioica]